MLISYIEDRPYLTLILSSILLFYINLDVLPVSIMEARNFIVAREMLTENNWFLTTMNGIARYEKPPLPSWITSFFVSLFDNQSTWVYRLPVSVFSTMGLIGVYKLSFALSNLKTQSLYAALILGTSFYYVVIRFEAPSDMFTHVAMIFSLFYLVRVTQEKKIIYSAVIGGLWLAASILSKGPVSLYVLWLPFIIAYAVTFKFEFKKKIGYYFIYIGLGLLLGASWYVYVRLLDPVAFLEIAETETSNWSSYNVRPFYYYWSFFIQTGIWTIPALISLAYPYFKNKVENNKLYLFSIIWTLAAVVLLSIIPEKKSRYLMPVLIPLALNTVQIIFYFIKEKNLKFNKTLATILLIVCLAIIVAPPFVINHSFQFWLWYTSMASFALIIGFNTTLQFSKSYLKTLVWNYFFIIILITSIGMNGVVYLQKNKSYSKTISQKAKNLPIYYYEELSPELIFASGKISQPINFDVVLKSESLILVPGSVLSSFKNDLPEHIDKQSIEHIDLNFFNSKDDKSYKSRLQVDLIKVLNERK